MLARLPVKQQFPCRASDCTIRQKTMSRYALLYTSNVKRLYPSSELHRVTGSGNTPGLPCSQEPLPALTTSPLPAGTSAYPWNRPFPFRQCVSLGFHSCLLPPPHSAVAPSTQPPIPQISGSSCNPLKDSQGPSFQL